MQWKLIIARKERGLKQKDMAKQLELSVESYGMRERGQLPFQSDEMFIIGEWFGMRLDDIFLPRESVINRISERSKDNAK